MNNEYIPKLIRAALNNDKKSVEAIGLMIGRKLKKEDPDIANEVMKILACTKSGTDVMRSLDMAPVPVDRETRGRLAKLEEPINVLDPILPKDVLDDLLQFIKERSLIDKFLEEDVVPSNSILLHGKPGVGKTYIARWLSYKLNMPMVTLDLANSISSYLGRSGQNIKNIFQYTKEQEILLFLDEIDAIAKKRDDATDLGELKRLVNVLLKELEDCPVSCVVIGATNHPELLDKAIWRRFDRNLEIPEPGMRERELLFARGLDKRMDEISEGCKKVLLEGTVQMSAADVCKMCEHIKRRIILYPDKSVEACVIREFCSYTEVKTKEQKIEVCKLLKQSDKKMTLKRISEITGIPLSSVDRYLKG
ncbi:MAG: ATP-binding protein [Clostridiales bacterium]|nr:ATP-binding protein [Clostridiales bacterium]